MIRRLRPTLIAALLAPILAACVSTTPDPVTGLYAAPIGGAPATTNDTAYSPALRCLADRAAARGVTAPRIAVGPLADLTGRIDFDSGRKVSQGSALFAVAALGKAGAPVVERLSREVPDAERAYAKAHVLSDTPEEAGQSADNFRAIYAGEIAGSRYYLVGGITELNYNLGSDGIDLAVGDTGPGVKATATAARFVMNAAVDLRLVDTVSQEVVATASYQKQIVGRRLSGGLIDIIGGGLFDLSAGGSAMEPLQFATRTLVERGVYDFMADVYGVDRGECLPPEGMAVAGGDSLLRRRVLAQQASAAAGPSVMTVRPWDTPHAPGGPPDWRSRYILSR